jgi:hypothetical protein
MIEGFPREPTVARGGAVELCVSTDAPAFRAELYRWGAELNHQGSSDWFEGRPAPHHLPFHDWGCDNVGLDGEHLGAWPAYGIPIGAEWPPGVYLAVLVEGEGRRDGERPGADARDARALFVVRDTTPGTATSILYKLPLLTWHAYNQVGSQHYDSGHPHGGWCLYSEFLELPVGRPLSVSVRRPGGGVGGTPFDRFSPDPFDPTPRQAFVHWDAPAVRWLERAGYRVDFCTDLDLHEQGTRLLEPYRLLLSVGHDEYWSAAMRTALERFVGAGGNVAFLGGNTCWWQVAFDQPFAFRRDGHWFRDLPENGLTGVSFRNGGERPRNLDAPPVGFEVQHADHWIYAGTRLEDGNVFGRGPDEHLVGYECDGAHFDRAELGRGPVSPTGNDGTPHGFTILGVGDVGASGWGLGNRAATLGVHSPRGTVFTASTTDWARVLARGSPVVERITHNVLERLR